MITSLNNPLVKHLVRLRRQGPRYNDTLFLIEGETELIHALHAKIKLETVAYCPPIIEHNVRIRNVATLTDFLPDGSNSPELAAVAPDVYAKLAYRETTGGIIALAHRPNIELTDLQLPTDAFVLVVEGVEKPGNLGALLRTADGAGAHAVIVCDAPLDLYNPNVVRSSLGALFTVTTIAAKTSDTIAYLRQHQIKTIVTSPAAQCDYNEVDYTGPIAIAIGSENKGLSKQWVTDDLLCVRIPMIGSMDSLNLSCSGAIIMYEALRQRRTQKENG